MSSSDLNQKLSAAFPSGGKINYSVLTQLCETIDSISLQNLSNAFQQSALQTVHKTLSSASNKDKESILQFLAAVARKGMGEAPYRSSNRFFTDYNNVGIFEGLKELLRKEGTTPIAKRLAACIICYVLVFRECSDATLALVTPILSGNLPTTITADNVKETREVLYAYCCLAEMSNGDIASPVISFFTRSIIPAYQGYGSFLIPEKSSSSSSAPTPARPRDLQLVDLLSLTSLCLNAIGNVLRWSVTGKELAIRERQILDICSLLLPSKPEWRKVILASLYKIPDGSVTATYADAPSKGSKKVLFFNLLAGDKESSSSSSSSSFGEAVIKEGFGVIKEALNLITSLFYTPTTLYVQTTVFFHRFLPKQLDFVLNRYAIEEPYTIQFSSNDCPPIPKDLTKAAIGVVAKLLQSDKDPLSDILVGFPIFRMLVDVLGRHKEVANDIMMEVIALIVKTLNDFKPQNATEAPSHCFLQMVTVLKEVDFEESLVAYENHPCNSLHEYRNFDTILQF